MLFILAALALFATAFAQRPGTAEEGESRVVDFIADIMRPLAPGDSVINLLGNVVMYHNGAVISCDSARRYSDKHLECFGRVLINKDSTYIYGDRAVYNGEVNTAQVFAPLVKVVRGDATLYTYNFSFNTLDNIGRFWGTGTMRQNDNRLESERGYYYSDTGDFVCVDKVEMTNPDYKLMSDSVKYNMDTEVAEFYTQTYIWNEKGEMLSATAGKYYHHEARYEFTRDSYILTEKQEVWADSLDYYSEAEDAVLRRNIQIRDEEQKTMAFGDYGQYWGAREEVLLTQNPSMVTFDPESDSLYVRSDSMFVYSFPYDMDYGHFDSLRRMEQRMAREMEMGMVDANGNPVPVPDSLAAGRPEGQPMPGEQESKREERREERERRYEWLPEGDTVRRNDLRHIVAEQKRAMYELGDTLTSAMLTAPVIDSLLAAGVASEDIQGQILYNERKRELIEQELPVSDSLIYEVLESIGGFGAPPARETGVAPDSLSVMHETPAEVTETETAEKEVVAFTDGDVTEQVAEPEKLTRRQRRQLEQQQKREARKQRAAEAAGKRAGDGVAVPDSTQVAGDIEVMTDSLRRKMLEEIGVDSSELLSQDSTAAPVGVAGDSLGGQAVLVPDSTMVEQPEQDSLQRIIKAYYNVRIYREDFQAVCDSLVGFSKDSTFHLHIDPVLWNGRNQITSDVMDIFTKNEQLDRAFFSGQPLMISEVDSTRYNQIKGREMESFFRDNDIYRHNVNGNAQTLYYMMDEEADEPNAFMVVNSANITFFIEDKEMDRMIWRQDPDYIVYPIDDIPLDVNRFLEGFRWEIHRKPALRDVFDRSIRPSQREAYSILLPPQFPLTERIEEAKKRFMESRIWDDRVDTLPPHALEFVRMLQLE